MTFIRTHNCNLHFLFNIFVCSIPSIPLWHLLKSKMASSRSRRVRWKEPLSTESPKLLVSIPLHTKPTLNAVLVQIQNVATAVVELKEEIATESNARKSLQARFNELNSEKAKVARSLTQRLTRTLMKMLPCKTLAELDDLMNFIQSDEHFFQLVRITVRIL